MFKIRIDVPGFEKYTGPLGVVPFTDGISDREVTEQECARLGAIMKIVRLDNDEQIGAAANMVKSRHVSAQVVAPKNTPAEPKPEPELKLKHSKEALEALAEKDGMKAIRAIAEEYGVKGVQISKMIDEIVKAQLPKED